MTDTKQFIFYDISSPIQPRSYAPNPSKGRLALSFKGVPFKTQFVEMTDISKVRQGLNCPATRKFGDGSDYYTLPMLQDPSGKMIGDSFDIANYLEDTFPTSGGQLFPSNSTRTGLDYQSPQKDQTILIPLTTNEGSKNQDYARFNWHVDATFTAHVILVAYYMPFNPETREATEKVFLGRANLDSWEQFSLQGEARENIRASFKESLTSLAELYKIHKDGPFLEGKDANYADLIVGGWLNMFSECMPAEEWKDFRTWHDGVFAQLIDALHKNYYVCQ
ncbi:hypothetical protein OPT61_g7164 [Boeremia exigua]|uniref:Uncharacterized protein n=1 Tax=Boeremia exigua TaxID=749465 RepID=A0ACC2I3D4_9PLEO|nr:hypothetical protein OPT61_g7164 [Boeremia exigua]